jgi:hypothetical protein
LDSPLCAVIEPVKDFGGGGDTVSGAVDFHFDLVVWVALRAATEKTLFYSLINVNILNHLFSLHPRRAEQGADVIIFHLFFILRHNQ